MNPIQKIVLTNLSLGITDVKQNQATTRQVWDTKNAVSTPGNILFFQGCNSRQLPETNLTRNRLEVQGNLVVQKIVFSSLETDPSSKSIEEIFDAFGSNSLVNLKIGNSTLLKDVPLKMWIDRIKYINTPNIGGQGLSFVPLTSIVIPPQIEFELSIIPANQNWAADLEIEEYKMVCSIQGIGTQFSNKNY
jgi:hypothetical protein